MEAEALFTRASDRLGIASVKLVLGGGIAPLEGEERVQVL